MSKQSNKQGERPTVRKVHTIEDTCTALGASPATVRRLIQDGRLGSVRISQRRIGVSDVQLQAFIQQNSRDAVDYGRLARRVHGD